MLNHPTVERLRGLGLSAMADAFTELQNTPEAADLPREDWLGLLVDREATSRDNKRLSRRLRDAKLRQAAVVENTDFRTPRGLDRALFHKLAGCDWIRQSQHLVISGPTGVGKTTTIAKLAANLKLREKRSVGLITIDYRDVLSEILTKRLNNPSMDQVFPGFKPTARGVVTT